MAQKQNTFAAILSAFALLPQLVHKEQQTGKPNEAKHASVFQSVLGALIQTGGALVAANNPILAPLINAGIQAAVESAKAAGWPEPVPMMVVPVVTEQPQPIDPPVINSPASPAAPVHGASSAHPLPNAEPGGEVSQDWKNQMFTDRPKGTEG